MMVSSTTHKDDRDRLADAALVAFRRFLPPRLSEKSVRRLWELHPPQHAAWRAIVEAVRAAPRAGTAS